MHKAKQHMTKMLKSVCVMKGRGGEGGGGDQGGEGGGGGCIVDVFYRKANGPNEAFE